MGLGIQSGSLSDYVWLVLGCLFMLVVFAMIVVIASMAFTGLAFLVSLALGWSWRFDQLLIGAAFPIATIFGYVCWIYEPTTYILPDRYFIVY